MDFLITHIDSKNENAKEFEKIIFFVFVNVLNLIRLYYILPRKRYELIRVDETH